MSNNNPVLALRKAALAAMPNGPLSCTSTGAGAAKRVEIHDPREGKVRKLSPYGAPAKQLYKYYIQELGFDDTWIAPLDLDFQSSSGRFIKRAQPKAKPLITERSAYKGYLSCFKLHNYDKDMGLSGFDLLQQFKPQMEKALETHGALKVQVQHRDAEEGEERFREGLLQADVQLVLRQDDGERAQPSLDVGCHSST